MQKASYSRITQQLDFYPNAGPLVAHITGDAFILTAFLFTNHGKLYAVSQLLLPLLMFRAFALMHDCVHGSATKIKALGDGIGIVTGALCLLPYEPWKKIHLLHHKWTGNLDQDPSMGLIKQFPAFSRARVSILNFCWRHRLPGLAISQHFVFWAKSYKFVLTAESRAEKVKNALSILVPILLYAVFSWTKNVPGLLLYLAMVEIINFPHHLQMPMLEGRNSFPVYEQHQTARSCHYPRWFSRNALNNFNLHIEHHLFPRLPWYRLDTARDLVRAELQGEYTAGNDWMRENRQWPIEKVLAKNLTPPAEKAA
ncbi:MAG: fatty acid desaturase [Bacteriovoracia bacterium]